MNQKSRRVVALRPFARTPPYEWSVPSSHNSTSKWRVIHNGKSRYFILLSVHLQKKTCLSDSVDWSKVAKPLAEPFVDCDQMVNTNLYAIVQEGDAYYQLIVQVPGVSQSQPPLP